MLDIHIVMTTWIPDTEDGKKRLGIISQTLLSWSDIEHDGKIKLHVADDGTSNEMRKELEGVVEECWGLPYFFSQQHRKGVGASLNRGCIKAFEEDALVLYMVDDWQLLNPINLTPWVELIQTNLDIAALKLFPHPDLTGTIKYVYPGVYAMDLDRHHFAFATRPSLWHKRMFDSYGMFPENVSAYECERLYNEAYCNSSQGPRMWMALPDYWRHMGGVELGDITP